MELIIIRYYQESEIKYLKSSPVHHVDGWVNGDGSRPYGRIFGYGHKNKYTFVKPIHSFFCSES